MQRGSSVSASADKMLTEGVADELGRALHTELGQYAGAVIVDGLDAQAEIGSDAADRFSRCDGDEDLELAPGEQIVRPFGRAPASLQLPATTNTGTRSA